MEKEWYLRLRLGPPLPGISGSELTNYPIVLGVVEGKENPILSIWEGFEGGSCTKLHDAVASSEEVLSAHFLPDSSNQLVLTGKGQVSLWSFQKDGGEEGGGLEKKLGRKV